MRVGGITADQIGGAMSTQEALTIPVDYVGSAFDPPVGTVFTTQQQVDRMLAGAGETAFKHLQAVIDVLPKLILHNVNINCAAGVHRPQVGFSSFNSASWEFRGFNYLQHTAIIVNGSSPATWPALPGLGGLTVTGQQVGSGDPWIDVSGTPFTAGALKGRYAVTDAGQVLLIHDNTTSRIFVVNEISPVPTTVTITSTPGTIFRNSQTDTAGAAQNFVAIEVTDGQAYFNDLCIDGWGTQGGWTLALFGLYPYGEALAYDNIMLDRRTYFDTTGQPDKQQNPLIIQADSFDRDFISFNNLSLLAPDSHSDEETNFLMFCGGVSISFKGAYWRLGRFGCWIGNAAAPRTTSFSAANAVWDDCLDATQPSGNVGMLQAFFGNFIQLYHNGNGKINEMRNMQKPIQSEGPGCIGLRNGGWLGVTQGVSQQQCVFKNNAADLIYVGHRGTILPIAYTDGGGNTGFGISVAGAHASVTLTSDMTATGSAGDMEIAGVSMTYVDVVTNSPVVDMGNLNRVVKT